MREPEFANAWAATAMSSSDADPFTDGKHMTVEGFVLALWLSSDTATSDEWEP